MANLVIENGTTPLRGRLVLNDDAQTLAVEAAAWIAQRAAEAIATRSSFSIALSGGSTPKLLYSCLAASPYLEGIAWDRWKIFFGDERACQPDDPKSNFRMATESLLGKVPIPARNIFRMRGEAPDLGHAAAEYAAILEDELPHVGSTPPRLDLVLLGLGENGHTASLFPGTDALLVTDRWVTVGLADYEPHQRLTLTLPAINAARDVAFLVAGPEKANAIANVAAGSVPASRVEPETGRLTWFLDTAAASGLPELSSAE